jgi:tetratricopeptide (TPR) repeat protein
VERLTETVRERVRVDVREALQIAERALTIAESLDDDQSLARALRAKANALWFQGQCRPAVVLLEKAEQLFEEAGNGEELGRTLSTSIQPLMLVGEYDRALCSAARAREIFISIGDDRRLARLEINVANIHHRQEHYADALQSYENAYQKLIPYRDAEAIGVILHNMAVCLISLNDFSHALKLYEEARQFLTLHEMPLLAAQADYNIAYLHYLRGDYERALVGLRAASGTCAANGDAYHAGLCQLDQSDIYLELNLFEEGSLHADSAFVQFDQLGMGYEAGRSLLNLAIAATMAGRKDRALAFLERARLTFAKEAHRAGEALVDLYQAILLFELGVAAEAELMCRRAADFFRPACLVRKSILCDLLLVRVAAAKGNHEAARKLCLAALKDLESIEAPALAYHAHLLMAQLSETLNDLQASYDAYQAARNQLEQLRCSLQGEELRIAFMQNKIEVFEGLVRLCLAQGVRGPVAEEAFGYMEQAKSRSLIDSLFGRAKPLPLRLASQLPNDDEISQLRGELNWYYHRIDLEQIRQDGVSSERLAGLWLRARECEERLLKTVRKVPGSPGRDISGKPLEVSLPQLQSILGPHHVLVEYFQTGDRIVAAVVTVDRVQVLPVCHAGMIRGRLGMLHLQLSKFALGLDYTGRLATTLLKGVQRRLKEMYDSLVAPFEPLLKGRHLIVVPHGSLHYLPFHALFDGNEYLIDRFTVSYAPSAGIYALCCERRATSAERSLILGIPDANTPWILPEVQQVASVVPAPHLLIGADANLESLRRLGKSSRMIHIATHGSFRSDNPMFSAVRLGDSSLSLYDLYSLQLPVELLTLSGCATGLNVVAAGDELIGLTRGLLYAGARSLLLTLWDVHDRTTADFMSSFYTHLERNMDNKALALRQAMLELRQQHAHPYFWAPFVVSGKAP